MAARLWADIPDPHRRVARGYDWRGCPYAVSVDVGGFRRCAGVLPNGAGMCAAHDSSRVPSPPRIAPVLSATRSTVRRHLGYDERTLKAFRSITDHEILTMRNVGPRIAAVIRDIRDTWGDERTVAFFDFDPEQAPSGPTEAFWAQSRDVFSMVGG